VENEEGGVTPLGSTQGGKNPVRAASLTVNLNRGEKLKEQRKGRSERKKGRGDRRK